MIRRALVFAALVAVAPGSHTAAAQDAPVTVYSSLPLSGASRPQSMAIVRGARLALDEAGGRAGAHAVRYVSLNSATHRAGSWVPRRAFRNARRAARDRSTIGYIGEFNSGASSIAIPVLNRRGIAQISPSNTYTGLTRGGPGTTPGEPAKYYPRNTRTYFRLMPNDLVQGAALATAMRDAGCTSAAFIDDGEIYGRGVSRTARRAARRVGMPVVATATLRRRARNARRAARRVARRRPDCVAFGGITANGAVRLFRDVARRLPRAKLYGSDGIAESGFTERLRPRVARRMVVTVSTLAPSDYPAQGQDVLRRYGERYRGAYADPYALYGYEAMRLFLDAVAAGGRSRAAVVNTLHGMGDRDGVVGRYSFDRFGDTTQRTYGLYRISRGLLQYAGAVTAR